MAWNRWSFCADLHGNLQDKITVDAHWRFLKDWKPKYKIFGGDLWDMKALRSKAKEAEKRQSIKEDFQAGYEWLEEYEPNKDLILGNHDARLWTVRDEKNGPISNYCEELINKAEALLKKFGIKSLPYDKRKGVLRFGHLKLLHGFFAGVTAARQHALAYGSCLFGHVHAVDEASVPGLDRRVARSVGAMCQLDQDYNSVIVNSLRHANGWAYGLIDEATGDYQVFQTESIDGKFVVAGDVGII